jgi:hypothetical protein
MASGHSGLRQWAEYMTAPDAWKGFERQEFRAASRIRANFN